MFDSLFGDLSTTFNDIVESDIFQAVIYVIVAYIALIWLASAYWAYRDMRLRTASAITPYVAALAIIMFTPIFFLFGLLLYRIVRPKETIAEVNERALAEETMLAEVASHAHCANCDRPVHEEWIICPTCRNRLRRVCPNCEHLIELDWTLCAWCGKDFERADAPGTTAYMPTARPAPLPQPQPAAPRLPAPPPNRPAPPPRTAVNEPSRTNAGPAAGAPQPGGPQPGGPTPPSKPQAGPTPPTTPQATAGPAPRSSNAGSTATGTPQPSGGAPTPTGI